MMAGVSFCSRRTLRTRRNLSNPRRGQGESRFGEGRFGEEFGYLGGFL